VPPPQKTTGHAYLTSHVKVCRWRIFTICRATASSPTDAEGRQSVPQAGHTLDKGPHPSSPQRPNRVSLSR
jgi:hypothetical protein